MRKLIDNIFSTPTPLKRIVIGAIVGLFFALVVMILYLLGVLDELEYIFVDFRTTEFTNRSKFNTDEVKTQIDSEFIDKLDIDKKYKLKETKSDSFTIQGDLIYLVVDDASLKQLEINDGLAYPWPRSVWANVTSFLYASEIKSLVYDISFFQSRGGNDTSDEKFRDALNSFNDTVLATAFTFKEAEDQFTHDIIQSQVLFKKGLYGEAFQTLALAYSTAPTEEKETAVKLYNQMKNELEELDKEKGIKREIKTFEEEYAFIKKNKENISDKISKYRIHNFKNDGSVKIDSALNVETPMDLLLGKPYTEGPTDSLGDVKLVQDSDGVSRRTVTVVEYNGNYYPSLSLAGVLEGLKFDLEKVNIEIKNKKLYVGNKEKARNDFNLYKERFKEISNDFIKNKMNKEFNLSLKNLNLILNAVDISKDVPINEIESLLFLMEKDFNKLDMLKKLADAYIYFNLEAQEKIEAKNTIMKKIIGDYNIKLNFEKFKTILKKSENADLNLILKDEIKNFNSNDKKFINKISNAIREINNKFDYIDNAPIYIRNIIDEVNKIFEDKFFTQINYRNLGEIKKILSLYGTENYKQQAEKIKPYIDLIPVEIYMNLSLLVQQIYVYLSKLGLVKDLEQFDPAPAIIEISKDEYKEVFDKINKLADYLEYSIRKINEVKNARVIPIDENGMLRLKFYGKYTVLPNISIYKVIKTWNGISELWEYRVSEDIVYMIKQYFMINALIHASENVNDLIVAGRLDDYYLSGELNGLRFKVPKTFPRVRVREYGIDTLVNILTEEAKTVLGDEWLYEIRSMDDLKRSALYNGLIMPVKSHREFSNLEDGQVFDFMSNIFPALVDIVWDFSSFTPAMRETLDNNGLDTLINLITGQLEKNKTEDINWAEFYYYKIKEEEKKQIYQRIGKEFHDEIKNQLELSQNHPPIPQHGWTHLVETISEEMLYYLHRWSIDENNFYELLWMIMENGEITEFLKTYIEAIKNETNLAKRLLEQKVNHPIDEVEIITLPKVDENGTELTYEQALDERLSKISIGALLIEEYIKLLLDSRGMELNDDNKMELFLEIVDNVPKLSAVELLDALYNILNNKEVSSEVRSNINDIMLIKPEMFKDKVVLVLTDAASLLDLRSTPFYSLDAGGNLHGHGILNIINNDYVKDYNLDYITIPIILVIGLLIGIMALLFPIKRSIVIFVVIFFIYNGVALAFHFFSDIFINMSAVSLGMSVCFLAGITFNFLLESKQKGFIEGAFAQFLAPEILNRLMEDPTKLTLGGETKELSIFFSDIAGFTSISEQLTPQGLVEILNYYLTKMADIIVVDNNGYVDKYEGDAVMAFWGAPVDDEQHAIKACYAALDNQKKLKEIQDYFESKGLGSGIKIRIGINTGEVVVGMMGSQKKLNYTVIGDAVNLASRLEGANKQFGTDIMISEHTYKKVKGQVEVRELDLIRVKGKLKPTRVYELIARKGNVEEKKKKILELYNQGLENYRDKRFRTAIKLFNKALEIDENDGPSKTYIERAENYIKNPPPEDWDGVFVMTTK